MNNSTLTLVAVVSFGCVAAGLTGCGTRTKALKPDEDRVARKPVRREQKPVTPALAKARPKQGAVVGKTKRQGQRDQAAGVMKPRPQVVQVAKPAAEQNKGDGPVKTEAKKLAGDGFPFPDDRGGKLLAALLAPHRQPSRVPSGHIPGPRRLPGRRSLERPELSLPPNLSGLPRPRVDLPSRPIRPRVLSGDAPLTWYRSDPSPPERRHLPDAARVRLPSVDLKQPLPLPLLGQGQSDRASLSDPSGEASLAAALAGTVSPRTTQAPFLRLSLPDPFENSRTVRLRTLLKEDEVPVNVGSQRPSR